MTTYLATLFWPSRTIRKLVAALLGALMVIGIFIAMVPSNYIDTGLEISDKILHATAFFGFAVLLDIASRKDFWRWQAPLLLSYGLLVEVLQSFVSWRTFSLLDLVADAVGILLYWLLAIYWLKPYLIANQGQPTIQ